MVFADRTIWQALQGEPHVSIVFRTSSAERRTVLLGYVGFFEAYFDGDVDIDGECAVGQLMRMAFSGFRQASRRLQGRVISHRQVMTKPSR